MSHPPHSETAAPVDETVVFDVRPISCRVKHGWIFRRWYELAVGRHFVLLNDHDPIPLHYQFQAEFPGAFSWEYLERGPDDFRVKITKLAPVTEPARPVAPPAAAMREAASAAGAVRELDMRGLEPPEPLIRILEALEALPAGAMLRARTDREPCHLFGEAESRGFHHECSQQPDGSWITTLARG
jgi:uncharacterized protein (DUF2249 family)